MTQKLAPGSPFIYGLAPVLVEAYPEHNWEKEKLNLIGSRWWESNSIVSTSNSSQTNRPLESKQTKEDNRNTFDSFGSTLGFQELDHWYQIQSQTLSKELGITSFNEFDLCLEALLQWNYNGSLLQALEAVYPHHQWSEWKFPLAVQRFWNGRDKCRELLDSIGKQQGFRYLEDFLEVKLFLGR